MKKIRVSQFAKMYEASWKGPEENKVYSIDETNKFNFIMAGDESKIPLKKFIKIKEPNPNEPPFMKRRNKPAALRFHKFNYNKDPYKYFFSEYLLYGEFKTEDEIHEKLKACNGNYLELQKEIQKVKNQVMIKYG